MLKYLSVFSFVFLFPVFSVAAKPTLPTPTNVEAKQISSNTVEVTWSDVGVSGVKYHVLKSSKNSDKGFNKAAIVKSGTRAIFEVKPNKRYFFRVLSKRQGYKKSERSEAVSLKVESMPDQNPDVKPPSNDGSSGGTGRSGEDIVPVVGSGAYTVRGVVLVGKDVSYVDPDWEAKYQTMLILIQDFFRKASMSVGLGDKTFVLAENGHGDPAVDLIEAPKNSAHYGSGVTQDWYNVYELMNQFFNMGTTKVSVMAMGAPSLGGGGLALTGEELHLLGRTIEEQKQIFCDSSPAPANEYSQVGWNLTRGQLASIRIGGMAHEIGHTFGLGHSGVGSDLMSAGFWGIAKHWVGSNCNFSPITTFEKSTLSSAHNTGFFK